MRYRLYYIRRSLWSPSIITPAPKAYYTGDMLTFEDIFVSGNGQTASYILTLNHSPEKDPKFKNLIPVSGYNQTYIVNIGADTSKFLLVGEESKLFNYNLIDKSLSKITGLASIEYFNKLNNLHKEIGLYIDIVSVE